jgi:arylsulfatase A-like enzyme
MHREAYEAARRLQHSRGVFNIDGEWEKYRDSYGDSAFGRRCLLARKLVEAGVAFVEVGQSSYDSHADNFGSHKGLVPPMDQAWAGLLADLKERGLLEKTLVVWTGEVGRTPQINNRAGRDHHVRSWTTALAGCGIKGGVVYGSSDEDGVDVKENPVREGDFFATIYHALSIDPATENLAGVRPVPLAPFGSQVVADLVA